MCASDKTKKLWKSDVLQTTVECYPACAVKTYVTVRFVPVESGGNNKAMYVRKFVSVRCHLSAPAVSGAPMGTAATRSEDPPWHDAFPVLAITILQFVTLRQVNVIVGIILGDYFATGVLMATTATHKRQQEPARLANSALVQRVPSVWRRGGLIRLPPSSARIARITAPVAGVNDVQKTSLGIPPKESVVNGATVQEILIPENLEIVIQTLANVYAVYSEPQASAVNGVFRDTAGTGNRGKEIQKIILQGAVNRVIAIPWVPSPAMDPKASVVATPTQASALASRE